MHQISMGRKTNMFADMDWVFYGNENDQLTADWIQKYPKNQKGIKWFSSRVHLPTFYCGNSKWYSVVYIAPICLYVC